MSSNQIIMDSPLRDMKTKCHCGKDGHAINSVNCPAHKPLTLKEVRDFLENSSVWDSEYIYQRKALLLQKFDEFIANKPL